MSALRPTPRAGPASAPAGSMRETLRAPWRWWVLAAMFWGSVLIAFLAALPSPAWAIVPVAVLGGLNAAVFASYSSARISLDPQEDGRWVLRAGRAHIDLVHLAAPLALDADQTRRLRGVDADARAYLVLRPYLSRSFRVSVLDAGDPTPYWLISTRHPDRWESALEAALSAHRQPSD